VRLNNDGRQQPLLTSTPLDINGISSKDPAKINESRYRLLILLIFDILLTVKMAEGASGISAFEDTSEDSDSSETSAPVC
jgi:hypothetical protein